jgi:hypothetical protein
MPDLSNASYEEFLDFVFNHLVEDEVDDRWYWHLDDEVSIPPRLAIEYLTRMCRGAGELVPRFTPRQIAQGLNYVFGPGGQDEFGEQLWNPDVPWPERQACIRAIPNLYSEVLERDPDGVGGCAFMLWDWIAYGYCCGNRDPRASAEDARVQDAMFAALVSMLDSDHNETLAGAIHGLGHLEHRDSHRVIRQLLSSNRALDPQLRQYAAQVLEGHFQ